MISIVKDTRNVIILILILLVVYLVRCKDNTETIIEHVQVPVKSIEYLPMPEKKIVSVKRQKLSKSVSIGVDTVYKTKDTVENVLASVYKGTQPIIINKLPANIPYEVTTTGELLDLKLGLDYSKFQVFKQPKISVYSLAGVNNFLEPHIGGSIVLPKYQVNYTYQPIQKTHQVTVGLKLFSIY